MVSCNKQITDFPYIFRNPEISLYNRDITPLDSLPFLNKEEGYIDLRGYDLTKLNLSDKIYDLLLSDFEDKTLWPTTLPDGFDPKKISEIGKNPGLGIFELHTEGITGENIGIGIIDQVLLVNHIEYKNNIKYYNEIGIKRNSSSEMHGSAVVSIISGETCGVAPSSDIYYIATSVGKSKNNEFIYDFKYMASAINELIDLNKNLPQNKKIKVISLSIGWDSSQIGYNEIMDACKKANDNDIFVVSSSISDMYENKYFFHGLGREPLNDPDDFKSFNKSFWGAQGYKKKDILLIPMDSRTTASPQGKNDYVFYRSGGWSWSIPYIAGIYALGCQVNPDLTHKLFWEKAIETGVSNDFSNGVIINPKALIEELKKIK